MKLGWNRFFLAAVFGALAVPAFADLQTLHGTVAYRERVALPPNALIEVTLVDVSLADAKSVQLGAVTLKPEGQVPVAYQVSYDLNMVDPRHSYAVQARIRVGEDVLWRTTQVFPALTRDAPEKVDVMVENTVSRHSVGLADTRWTVGSIVGVETVAQAVPELSFGADARVSGSGGCNQFTGTFDYANETLKFGPMASTRMACPGEIGTQETAFFKALSLVARAQMTDGQLSLQTEDGRAVMVLARQ